jgi:hypothetical protein
MPSMYITVPYRSSSAIKNLQVDALNSKALCTFTNGRCYEYDNVSKRAIINVLFNPDVSLGFWVNNNLVNTQRAEQTPELSEELVEQQVKTDVQLNKDEYQLIADRFANIERRLKNVSEPQLPALK